MPAQADDTNPLRFRLKTSADKFDITTQRERWDLWLQQWEVFMIISGLEDLVTTTDGAEDPEKQRAKKRRTMAALKQAFTIDTMETMNSLGLTDDQLQDHEAIIAAMTAHINGTSTPWVRRQELITRKRHEGEQFDDFLAALRFTASKCRLTPATRDLIITLTVIIGVREPEVTEKLLRMPENTTLEEVATKARAIMASKTDQSAITKGIKPTANRIQVVDRPPPQHRGRGRKPNPVVPGGCSKCGHPQHPPGTPCPAVGKYCMNCGTVGHYSRTCPKKTPGRGAPTAAATEATRPCQTTDATHPYQTTDAITPYTRPTTNSATARRARGPTQRRGRPDGGRGRPHPPRPQPRGGAVVTSARATDFENFKPLPLVPITLQGARREVEFLADTGANFSVISLRDYEAAGLAPGDISTRTPMARDPEMADGYTGGMHVIGAVRLKATANQRSTLIDLYVANRVRQPLLSRDATLALGALPVPGPQ